jgi:CRP/FNR family transcriptional regulator, cyclic AMP receptor protein
MVTTDAKILQQLKKVYGLSSSQIEKLARNLTVRNLKKGQIVFEQDDEAKLVYVLLSGVASVSYNGDGRETIVGLFPPGEFFGLDSLVPDSRHPLRCEAFELSTIGSVNPEVFAKILLGPAHEDFLPALATILHSTRRPYIHCIRGIGLDVRRRIALELSHLADDFGAVDARGVLITVAISHETLASLVGASRQQVTEYLNELDRDKIILREGRRFIVNPRSLRKVIESSL